MSEQNNNTASYYDNLTDKQKEVAIKIETFLNGLSLEDAQLIIRKVQMSVTGKAIIKSA